MFAGMLAIYLAYICVILLDSKIQNAPNEQTPLTFQTETLDTAEDNHSLDIDGSQWQAVWRDTKPFSADEWADSSIAEKLFHIVCVRI